MLLDVATLELHPIKFGESFVSGKLNFSGSGWTQEGRLNATGVAELLEPAGSCAIRVCGTIETKMQSTCARCLESVEIHLEEEIRLLYFAMSVDTDVRQGGVAGERVVVGFYEDYGLELADVLREQVMLLLPMRSICKDECKGICEQCGTNRNEEECDCVATPSDSRWDVLRKLQLKIGHQ
jgi:uncharacterized protein